MDTQAELEAAVAAFKELAADTAERYCDLALPPNAARDAILALITPDQSSALELVKMAARLEEAKWWFACLITFRDMTKAAATNRIADLEAAARRKS